MPSQINEYATVPPERSIPVSPILPSKSADKGMTINKSLGIFEESNFKKSEIQSSLPGFFNDPGTYIALGSSSILQDEVDIPSEWTQSFDSPKYIPADHPIYQSVCKLLRSRWILIHFRQHQLIDNVVTVRFHVLPDDVGRRYLDRDSVETRKALIKLVEYVDCSIESWEGRNSISYQLRTYQFHEVITDSLFYLYNTLPSPSPKSSSVSSATARYAMNLLLNKRSSLPGLKTALYLYQKRSAAAMIQRETEPLQTLDPRLESLRGPTEQNFYYDRQTGIILRDMQTYEEARGGFLAETMGLGKTLICLAAIIATKGHWPKIPPQYSINLNPIRPKTGSLMQMAAATIGREQIPWKTFFQTKSQIGENLGGCEALLKENAGSYVVPPPSSKRIRRLASIPNGERIYLCSATLIIVPQNLFFQWTNQIALHLNEGSLKVLHMDNIDSSMPSVPDILSYDIILMSKNRFEREMKPLETDSACSSARNGGSFQTNLRDRYGLGDRQYRSPLLNIHFLRIIVDEGHDFASSGRKNNAIWALQKLHVERRWIVSGTPAAGLLGVELDLAAIETKDKNSNQALEKEVLEARRFEILTQQERQDLEKLGRIVIDFLQVRPWANDQGEDRASWHKYVMPFKGVNGKPKSLRSILKSLVVRHRIEDVDADVQLPPLQNKVVYLKPSWHDKLSINLFILTLTANAVTSERTDQDYMFHQSNRAQLDKLITNLRQSAFYWVSFPPTLISSTLEVCQSYLSKKLNDDSLSHVAKEDFNLLEHAMQTGYQALDSPSWKAFAVFQELGIFVEGFPEDSRCSWSLVRMEEGDLLLTGATQLSQAQKYVDSHLYSSNPAYGLAELGEFALKAFQQGDEEKTELDNSRPTSTLKSTRQVKSPPSSKNLVDLKLTEKHTLSKARGFLTRRQNEYAREHSAVRPPENTDSTKNLKSLLKKPTSAMNNLFEALPLESPLTQAKIIGTASAKLSYLIDRVLALQEHEKILIFYRGDHIAYFIAQAFDLVNIRYLIYTGSITTDRRSIYITTFNKAETFRVMLMDVRQAAHGLHVASASRVFFVNPEWQPNIEAQAIKRAHRIGQTRPVYVETLVLEGTLEDQMLQRRKRMSTEEHQTAQKSLIDDPVMKELIENLKPIPISQDEASNLRYQIALLKEPQRIFGRTGYKGSSGTDNPDSDLILPEGTTSWKAKPGTRKRQFSYEPSPDATDAQSLKKGKLSQRSQPDPALKSNNQRLTSQPVANHTSHNINNNIVPQAPQQIVTAPPVVTSRRVAFALNQDGNDEGKY